jgi:RNA polymerase-binding transcription factor DksA
MLCALMTIGSPEGSPPPWKEVHRAVLEALDALAKSNGWIQTAAAVGIEPVFERVLEQACVGPRVAPAAYLDSLSREPELRAEIRERLARLSTHPELVRLRRASQRREAEHHLYTLRYVLTGLEPPARIWEALNAREQARLRESAASGEERDAALSPRVERALEKLTSDGAYGECEDCGDLILLERLQLIPWAECCAPCQRERQGTPAAPPPVVEVRYF